ncbi:hypothetical protein PR048_015396 [Dryococelus australis]|uniref:DUF4817 domain-containing protein n=1 Tax=Dryococelus australis TaxID=614101 RepID=A0ABQ9HH38_9NEOP|nr:hypothetical protein PR048_015396 [Dryococelus australis]
MREWRKRDIPEKTRRPERQKAAAMDRSCSWLRQWRSPCRRPTWLAVKVVGGQAGPVPAPRHTTRRSTGGHADVPNTTWPSLRLPVIRRHPALSRLTRVQAPHFVYRHGNARTWTMVASTLRRFSAFHRLQNSGVESRFYRRIGIFRQVFATLMQDCGVHDIDMYPVLPTSGISISSISVPAHLKLHTGSGSDMAHPYSPYRAEWEVEVRRSAEVPVGTKKLCEVGTSLPGVGNKAPVIIAAAVKDPALSCFTHSQNDVDCSASSCVVSRTWSCASLRFIHLRTSLPMWMSGNWRDWLRRTLYSTSLSGRWSWSQRDRGEHPGVLSARSKAESFENTAFLQEKAQCVLWFHEKQSPVIVQRKFQLEYGRPPPDKRSIVSRYTKFKETGTVFDHPRTGWPSANEAHVEVVQETFSPSPSKSTRRECRELGIPRSRVQKILHKRLKYHAYKVQILHALHKDDSPRRGALQMKFCNGSIPIMRTSNVCVFPTRLPSTSVASYLEMLELYVMPQLHDLQPVVTLQQEWRLIVREFLDETFPGL